MSEFSINTVFYEAEMDCTNPSFDSHESVVAFDDHETGLAGYIAVHSTALGPAAGGCRWTSYLDSDAALTDALRLSQSMSYKNALAGLPAGGGKSVIYRARPGASRADIFKAFGDIVERQAGRYVTAEDVGTTVEDMQVVRQRTAFVAGLPAHGGVAGGDPSPWTALGVFVAIEASVGRPLRGTRVAVQGLGSVGLKLCRYLHEAGASLVVADLDQRRIEDARSAFGADVADVDQIHETSADVFSPNALGAILNANTIPRLGAPVVCGGANNQLATPRDGWALFERGVVYTPDYVANAGGIINAMAEYLGESAQAVEGRVRAIRERVDSILRQSQALKLPSNEIADRLARERIGRVVAEAQVSAIS